MGALVRLHICGNTNAIFPFLSEVNADIVDLDSMAVIADARQASGRTACFPATSIPFACCRMARRRT